MATEAGYLPQVGVSCADLKFGMVTVSDGKTKPQPVRLQLTPDAFILQREELCLAGAAEPPVDGATGSDFSIHDTLNSDGADSRFSDQQERRVTLQRQPDGGLGLSIKGGIEHHLPILISRIFKDQAADLSESLFVGDAIVAVNDASIEAATHDEAVAALKNAGNQVTLVVRHFPAATPFLVKAGTAASNASTAGSSNYSTRARSGSIGASADFRSGFNGAGTASSGQGSLSSGSSGDPRQVPSSRVDRHWVDVLAIPLLMANVTRYMTGTDKARPNAFELVGMDSTSSGIIICDDGASLEEWVHSISDNIAALNAQTLAVSNKGVPVAEYVFHACWVGERVTSARSWPVWRPRFLALKGAGVYLLDQAPVNARDWIRCAPPYVINECMLRALSDAQRADERRFALNVQTGGGDSHYFSVETRRELASLEKAWHVATYVAVSRLKTKTYGCIWRGKLCGLTLDLAHGFSLYDSESRIVMWRYKFSQLKGSSDDGKTRLKLHFQDEGGGGGAGAGESGKSQIETKEVDCSAMKALLFGIHAFLTAKLASVDPAFLNSVSHIEKGP